MRVKPIDVPIDYELLNCHIQNLNQLGDSGACYLTYEKSTKMSLKNYRASAMLSLESYRSNVMAEYGRFPEYLNDDEIDYLFWVGLTKRSPSQIPIYAVDNEFSRFPKDLIYWNLNNL